jgi:hypothetical protein
MERAQIVTDRPNLVAKASVVAGTLALVAGPAGVLVSQHSQAISLHLGIAGGGGAAAVLALLTLVLARRGHLRAGRSIDASGARAASGGRLLGTLALCIGIAAGIALATDAFLTHFQN